MGRNEDLSPCMASVASASSEYLKLVMWEFQLFKEIGISWVSFGTLELDGEGGWCVNIPLNTDLWSDQS